MPHVCWQRLSQSCGPKQTGYRAATLYVTCFDRVVSFALQMRRASPPQEQQPAPPDAVFGPGSRPDAAATGDVCLALDYLEDPAAHGVTSPEGVMEPAVFLCDIASLPGAWSIAAALTIGESQPITDGACEIKMLAMTRFNISSC